MTLTVERLISQPVSLTGSFGLAAGKLKRFICVGWSIPFYSTPESRKVMPILASEMSDLNPDRSWWKMKFPGANPFFHHCSFLQYYVAHEDGKAVGRIAAFIDRSYGEPEVDGAIGWIGLFESIDDDGVAAALLGAAADDLEQAGAVKVIGPARFNANGEDGLLVDGFDQHPMVMEPYQPPYYTRFLEQWGVKENDWYAFRMTRESASPYMERLVRMRERGQDVEQRLARQGVAVRSVRIRDWAAEVARIKTIYNVAWDTRVHPQFERFSEEEFDYLAAGLRMIAIEDLVFVVEDLGKPGHPVIGMAVTLPDLNEVIEEYDRLHTGYAPSSHLYGLSDLRRDLGVFLLLRSRVRHRNFRNARIFVLGTVRKKNGIDALLYEKTYLAGTSMGIQLGSGSQIADTNPEISVPLSHMGSAAITWRIYRHTQVESQASQSRT
ncbi:MAG: hypothetical protein NTX94_00870 [Caldiserica bacterium]|nr:hypothetical protein [Caldisericota bacterium]